MDVMYLPASINVAWLKWSLTMPVSRLTMDKTARAASNAVKMIKCCWVRQFNLISRSLMYKTPNSMASVMPRLANCLKAAHVANVVAGCGSAKAAINAAANTQNKLSVTRQISSRLSQPIKANHSTSTTAMISKMSSTVCEYIHNFRHRSMLCVGLGNNAMMVEVKM